MNRITRNVTLTGVALATALSLGSQARAEVFEVDKTHSEVGFGIRHFVSKVRGRFNDFEGTVNLDEARPEASSVEFKVKATSIDTADAKRDAHLRSADFFDVEKFPEITFKSTSVKKTGNGTFAVTGPFTMHGVTKDITLPVTLGGTMKDPWGNTRAGFEILTKLDRKDYKIEFNKVLDTGGTMLGDEVEVAINLETVHKKPAEPGEAKAGAAPAKPGDAAKPAIKSATDAKPAPAGDKKP